MNQNWLPCVQGNWASRCKSKQVWILPNPYQTRTIAIPTSRLALLLTSFSPPPNNKQPIGLKHAAEICQISLLPPESGRSRISSYQGLIWIFVNRTQITRLTCKWSSIQWVVLLFAATNHWQTVTKVIGVSGTWGKLATEFQGSIGWHPWNPNRTKQRRGGLT